MHKQVSPFRNSVGRCPLSGTRRPGSRYRSLAWWHCRRPVQRGQEVRRSHSMTVAANGFPIYPLPHHPPLRHSNLSLDTPSSIPPPPHSPRLDTPPPCFPQLDNNLAPRFPPLDTPPPDFLPLYTLLPGIPQIDIAPVTVSFWRTEHVHDGLHQAVTHLIDIE